MKIELFGTKTTWADWKPGKGIRITRTMGDFLICIEFDNGKYTEIDLNFKGKLQYHNGRKRVELKLYKEKTNDILREVSNMV